MQREHKHREKAKDTVFTEAAGKVFTEDCASEFTGSEKLKKKQKQAQKAAEQVRKEKGKLKKKREYTLQTAKSFPISPKNILSIANQTKKSR